MKTMAEVLVDHQRHNLRSCLCGWDALGKSHPEHQEAMLTAAGFGLVTADTSTEWGVRRDADSAVHSREQAERTIEVQRKRKLKTVLIKRQVGPWELAEP